MAGRAGTESALLLEGCKMMSSTTKAKWDALSVKAAAHNEHRDCTVRALTASTGLDYDVCHEAFRKLGRKNRRGVHWSPTAMKAANSVGFNMRRLLRNEYSAKTMITAERDPALRAGRYCVLVRGHVAALVDGQIIDWTQGRRHKIQAVYEVTPMATAPVPAPIVPDYKMPKGSATWQAFKKYNKRDNLELF
jgi:hypothetical protein